ncbi:MAG: hypothetical protein IJ685_13055 [Selenomonadaceae bacterium]|nr:hypothetical protein [Selenomonadaceae bacterium]
MNMRQSEFSARLRLCNDDKIFRALKFSGGLTFEHAELEIFSGSIVGNKLELIATLRVTSTVPPLLKRALKISCSSATMQISFSDNQFKEEILWMTRIGRFLSNN